MNRKQQQNSKNSKNSNACAPENTGRRSGTQSTYVLDGKSDKTAGNGNVPGNAGNTPGGAA